MIRVAALSLALVDLAQADPLAVKAGAPGSRPRPGDQYGRRYQIMTGAYQSRGKTQGGGTYVMIAVNHSPISVPVSGGVFSAAGKVRPVTRMTLAGSVGHPMSGAMPPYICIELPSCVQSNCYLKEDRVIVGEGTPKRHAVPSKSAEERVAHGFHLHVVAENPLPWVAVVHGW